VYPQLRINPFHGTNIRKLQPPYRDEYRYRTGDVRIFYKILPDRRVVLLDIDFRQNAYNA
jgi:mRNA interferase RelE/StbE